MKPTAYIRRTKLAPGPGKIRTAKWVYYVNGVCIGSSLKDAEKWAKNRGMTCRKEWDE